MYFSLLAGPRYKENGHHLGITSGYIAIHCNKPLTLSHEVVERLLTKSSIRTLARVCFYINGIILVFNLWNAISTKLHSNLANI